MKNYVKYFENDKSKTIELDGRCTSFKSLSQSYKKRVTKDLNYKKSLYWR